jgi:DNA polymerase type B, organellar and viral
MDLASIAPRMDEMFEDLVREPISQAKDRDKICISISHSKLQTDVFVTNCYKQNFDPKKFSNKIFELAQSSNTCKIFLHGVLEVHVTIIENTSGGYTARRHAAPRNRDESCFRKKSVVTITSKSENSCFWNALATALFYANNTRKGLEWKKFRNKFNRDVFGVRRRAAEKLAKEFLKPYCKEISQDDLVEVQHRLPYQMVVIDRNTRGPHFRGKVSANAKGVVFLEFIANSPIGHFNFISSITGYFAIKNKFCHHHWRQIKRKYGHLCNQMCQKCYGTIACEVQIKFATCLKCKIEFDNENCFLTHKSICCLQQLCSSCLVTFKSNEDHECFIYNCKKCNIQYSETPHYCFITPLNLRHCQKDDASLKMILAFDIESAFQDIGDNVINHVPILLIAKMVCDCCVKHKKCKFGTCNEFIYFRGKNCVRDFCDYIYFTLAKKAENLNARITCFAHNLKNYDGRFILRDLWERKFENIRTVVNGTKILKIEIGNIRFIDSLSYLNQPLEKLPKCFGFEDTSRKGWFPYFSNTIENQNKIIHFPPREKFGTESMSAEKLKEFEQWYKKQEPYYDLQKEMESYCESDVDILLNAVMKFRSEFKNITDVDPFTRTFTLPGVGMDYFRSKILKPYTLALTPVGGYQMRNSSKIASAWLDVEEMKRNKLIAREVRIGKYFSDGADLKSREIFEFYGCHYHGHNCTYEEEDVVPKLNKKASLLRRELDTKRKYYLTNGFTLIEKYECEIDSNVKDRLKYYIKLDKVGSINIRESFFGGRTEVFKFVHITKNDKIRYLDVTSLYPYVLSEKQYPIGHPRKIRHTFDYTLKKYFGFIKCKVLPPQNLFIPILPFRVNKKLVFTLCRSCSELQQLNDCHHTPDERALIGTWTHCELAAGLEEGYVIMDIFEVLHYPESSDQLFKEYIHTFMKVKQEASGWPKEDMTEEEKAIYIQEYFENEGIKLDPSKIETNSGRRFIAKLMLNSFYGRLAQRPNLPVTEYISNYDDYWKVLSDEEKEILGEFMVTENTVCVNWRYVDIENSDQNLQNIAVGSFVTSYARLHLYKYLKQITNYSTDALLYCDTDSCIFIEKDGKPDIKTGIRLGELTDELAGAECLKAVFTAPKSYALEVYDPRTGETKQIIKNKGIMLRGNALQIVTLERMMEMAEKYYHSLGAVEEKLSIPQHRIFTDKKSQMITSKEFFKDFRVVSKKRRIIGNATVPYGFQKPRPYVNGI